MTRLELVTAADVQLMQGLAQRVTATRLDLVNSDALYGELSWNWGKGHAADGASWRRRLWFSGGDLVAWSWAHFPRRVRRSDGSVKDVTSAYLAYQVHPEHAGLVDEVIDWYDGIAGDIERTVRPSAADEFALKRWAAHGYETDRASLGDAGASPGARVILQRRVSGAIAGRAAYQNQDRGLRTGRSGSRWSS